MTIERPIFLLGMPRSGTTLIFEIFANHPGLGWLSFRFNRFPRWPVLAATSRLCALGPAFRKSVGRSDQRGSLIERLREGPSEAYRFWAAYCGDKFLFDYLLGARATEKERTEVHRVIGKVLRYQGKGRFAAKLTGPARIGYLRSIFDDALFINIVRDGRAVVHSLMNVDFWKQTFRLTEPAWSGGLTKEALERWHQLDRSPLALAALEWRAVLETTWRESADLSPRRYLEIRYEDFLATPGSTLERLCDFCGLPSSPEVERFLAQRVRLKNMNYQFRERFTPEELAMLEEIMGDLLIQLGYPV